jgi:hypothetical protein
MSSSSAYSAQNPYITAYFRQQHPPLMKWNLLLNGFEVADNIAHLPHLELGFGQGLGLMLSAASQSEAAFVGVDFMAEHVDAVAKISGNCQLSIDLYAQDFSTFLQSYHQQVQSISLHGVWSWVDPEVRAQLVEIFDKLLAQGGMVYLSHNTLPGRAPLMPLQRLLHLTGKQIAQHTPEHALETAFATLGSALSMSHYAQQTPTLRTWWQEVQHENPIYLEHEYMSDAWYPMLFADTAKKLAKAGLTFVCSADAVEQIAALHLTDSQQSWLIDINDINLRESYQDLMRNTDFRRDLWGKGLIPLTTQQKYNRLLNTSLVLIQPIGALPYVLKGDLGEFELSDSIYEQALTAFATIEKITLTGAGLQHILNGQGYDVSDAQMVAVLHHLTAIGYIHPAQSEQDWRNAVAASQSLNQYICRQALVEDAIHYLASPLAGCGIQVSRWQQLCLLARHETASDDVSLWIDWMTEHPQVRYLMSTIDTDNKNARQVMAEIAHQFQTHRLQMLLAHQSIV